MKHSVVLLSLIAALILQTGCSGDSDPDTTPGFSGFGSSSSSSSSSGGGLTIEENTDGFCHVDGSIVTSNTNGATGDGYADPDNDQTNGLDYRVNVPEDGEYELTFRYATSAVVEGSVAVNESSQTPITFPARSSATDWGDATVTVELAEGDNDINLGTSSGAGVPNIDSLAVSGEGVSAVSCAVEADAQNMAACNALTGAASSTVDPDELMGYAGFDALGVATTTGGGGATPVTVTTFAELDSAVDGDAAKVVEVSGTLTGSGMIDVGSNTTIVGQGDDAVLDGFGLKVDGKNNVIIENLTFTNSSDDGITIEDGAHHVWVHHNTFMAPIVDGSVDMRRNSSYITVSWNRFVGTDKTSLIGSNDIEYSTLGTKVTYHHNWFDGTVQRNPRVRFADVHIFNNHYDGVTSYGVVSIQFANVLFEGNYLDLTSSDNRASSTGGVAESPHKGDIVACNNAEISGVVETRGLAFDPGEDYAYNMQDAADVPGTVTANAGPQP